MSEKSTGRPQGGSERTGEGGEELGRCWVARAALALGQDVDSETIRPLEHLLRDPPHDELDRPSELAQLVDRQDAVAHELGLGAGELGEDETRAVAQEDVLREADRLEVLGLARRRRDRHLLLADEGVDGGRLADVGVADEADDELLVAVSGRERDCGRSASVSESERQDERGGREANAPSGARLMNRSSSSSTLKILVRGLSSDPGTEMPMPRRILPASSSSESSSLSSSVSSPRCLTRGRLLAAAAAAAGAVFLDSRPLSLLPDLGIFMPGAKSSSSESSSCDCSASAASSSCRARSSCSAMPLAAEKKAY